MTRALTLATALILALAAAACGDDKKNDKPGDDAGPGADSGRDAQQNDDDAAVSDDDASVDETDPGDGFDSDLDPGTQLSDLTEAEGMELCNDAQAYANSQLTEEQRSAASCILGFLMNQQIPDTIETCEADLAACMQNGEPNPLFNPLDFGCDDLDVTTECPGSATVGDVEGCANGFSGIWSFVEPITDCEGLVGLDVQSLTAQAIGALGGFQSGLAQCGATAMACPDAIMIPDVIPNP